MKKTLSLILALLMSVSTATAALATEPAIDSTVENGAEEVVSPYADAVKYLEHYNIYKGNENGLDTESDVNRWQMALFAARVATGWTEDDKWENGPLNSSEFTDLAGTYAEDVYGAISYVNQMGIIEGYGDGTFGPTKNITYQDALTIVVRTLGYKNLEYPWGYIQKAVELDLTKDVVDVAYTDALTRGETAQVIYNALFAETKNGSTLGLESFGIEFAWENVIITASDRDTFTAIDTADSSFVAFQLVEDGELSNEVYYAKAADFGLTGHEDELAVGASYKVFFEKDADSELAKIIDYKTNYVGSAWNLGKTDDAGVAVEAYDIETLFDTEYKLVSKYSANYLGNKFAAKDEMIVVNALGTIKVIEYTGKSNIGIDMNTGDIVKFGYDEENAEEIVVEEILWHWNEIVERYYQIVFDDEDVIGVKYMDEAEEAKLLKAIKDSTAVEKTVDAFAASAAIDEDSAYASLDVYEVNGKAYGIYEEYKFGYFKNTTNWCCNANRASYAISAVLTFVNGDGVITSTDDKAEAFNQIVEGACKHGTAWINPAFAANATETGYADGYVIYSADKQTGEIKIVKYINDCADADTYVAYGSVKAYSVADEYVVIGGEKLYFNYDNLEGAEMVFVKQNKAEYSDILRALLNQYVKYVVVDGEIVHIEVSGNSASNLFVVEQYVGISSNGYIVVDGYWTADASNLTRALINTYNNSYTGDHYYYMTAEKAAKAFTKGAIYAVSSTEEDGSLNVQIVGEVTADGYKVVKTSKYVDLGKSITITTENAAEGYLTIDGATTRDKGYTYILIGDKTAAGYAPMAVFTGKINAADWTVTGTRVSGTDSSVYLIVNATWKGFGRDNGTTGVVALLGDHYWSADFDGATADDWYVLGAAEYEVAVFDFYTASTITVKATNLELEEGAIYRTIDGTIVYDDAIAASALYAELKAGYADKNGVTADYIFGTLELTAANIGDVETTISKDVSKVKFTSGKEYTDLVGDVKAIKMIETDGDKVVAISTLNKAALEALAEEEGVDTVTVEGFYIYNNSTSHAYVYAYADVASSTGSDEITVDSPNVIEAHRNAADELDAYITTEANVSVAYENEEIASATLNSLVITFAGEKVENDTHKAIANNYFTFGKAGECEFEDWNLVVDGETRYGTIVAEVYEGHDAEDICNMIKAIVIDDIDLELTEETQYIEISFTNSNETAAKFVIGAKITADGVKAGISKSGSEYGIFKTIVSAE